ncbi:MAG: TonB-dependent receptor [Ignavibacteriae bacterium]|nr:TonB-dependent receptor [Ignavibacteriota bacterium]
MKKYLLTTIYCFSQLLLIAQTDTLKSELTQITVSANKYETNLFNTASSVSIITQEQIQAKQSHSVIDLLNEVPGLTISQQGGTGKLSSVFLRGANSNFVLVMIDNVEVNNPASSNNSYDFSALQVDDIERIEIVRGPQSTLYGSEASAGVINILTKSGIGKPSFSFSGEGGSNNFYKGSFTSKGVVSGLSYLANFSRLQTDAISSISGINFETDAYYNNSGFVKLGYDFSENLNLNFAYKYIESEADLDQAEKNGDDPNYISDLESHLFNLNLNGTFFNGIWESSIRGSYFQSKSNAVDKIDAFHPSTLSDAKYFGKRVSFDWQNNFKLINNNLITIGINSKNDIAQSNYYSESMWGPFESVLPEERILTTGIYVQDFITINNFSATVGYRFDNNEKFGSVSTFRIAPMYFIEDTKTKIKGTYGTGFKAPSIYNLFDPLTGNIELKPEESAGWDFGFDQFLLNDKIMIGVTYFNMEFTNMLGFDENFKSVNINKAETKGIETSFTLQNIFGFTVSANYTFNETFDISNKEIADQQLIRRPKHQFAISSNYKYDKLNLGLFINHSGEKFDNDFSTFPTERIVLKSYTLVNLTSSYSLTEYLTIYGRLENMFDTKYEDILYYGTLGRSAYFGFELNL